MKKVPFLSILAVCMMLFANTVLANQVWKEISDDGKYGKFFEPASVKRLEVVNGVATNIGALIKTTFSPEAAAETVANYEIAGTVDPAKLAWSVAAVEMNPQHRTIEYVKEDFFDAAGNVIWSKTYEPRTEKEINSMAFDEDYYAAVIDVIFRQGEMARCRAADRWKSVWQTTLPDGSSQAAMVDTSTLRQRGEDNLIYWEWTETKNITGDVTEVKFLKKTLQLAKGSEKVLQGRVWTLSANAWKDVAPKGDYETIPANGPRSGGLTIMRAYAKGYQYWLNRYRTDKKVGLPGKKAA